MECYQREHSSPSPTIKKSCLVHRAAVAHNVDLSLLLHAAPADHIKVGGDKEEGLSHCTAT